MNMMEKPKFSTLTSETYNRLTDAAEEIRSIAKLGRFVGIAKANGHINESMREQEYTQVFRRIEILAEEIDAVVCDMYDQMA
jgi:hypothetical protein